MKSFEDFLSSVDLSDMEQETKKINSLAKTSNSTAEEQIVSAGISYSLYFLRKYHEWLADQL